MNKQMAVERVSAARVQLQGAFDLRQTIGFGFGQREGFDEGLLRLAFCLDGYDRQVGVVVRQREPAVLDLEIHADEGTDVDAITAQVARMLSVDVDATGYDRLAGRDPFVARVQRTRPGLRPPLFHSAYEAALWGVLSARQPATQMARVREGLGRAHGRVFQLAGQDVASIPLPQQLLAVDEVPGLFGAKLPRLLAIAQAALDGRLDTPALRSLDPAHAIGEVQKLPGLGPFYSELVVMRALGHTDVLPRNEPRCRQVAAELVGAPGALSQLEFEELAQAWRPWRTWVVVGLRAAAALASPTR